MNYLVLHNAIKELEQNEQSITINRRDLQISTGIDNIITKYDNYVNIHMTSIKHGEFDSQVDLEEYEKIIKHHWGIFISKYGAF